MRIKIEKSGIEEAIRILERAGFQKVKFELINFEAWPEEEGSHIFFDCAGRITFEIPEEVWKVDKSVAYYPMNKEGVAPCQVEGNLKPPPVKENHFISRHP